MAKYLCEKCGFGAVPFPTDDEMTNEVYNFFKRIMNRQKIEFDSEKSETDEDEQQRAHEEDLDQDPSDWFEHGELFGLRQPGELAALTLPAPSASLALEDGQVEEDGDEEETKQMANAEQNNKKEDCDSETESATGSCKENEEKQDYKMNTESKKETRHKKGGTNANDTRKHKGTFESSDGEAPPWSRNPRHKDSKYTYKKSLHRGRLEFEPPTKLKVENMMDAWQSKNKKKPWDKPPKQWCYDARCDLIDGGRLTRYHSWDIVRNHVRKVCDKRLQRTLMVPTNAD